MLWPRARLRPTAPAALRRWPAVDAPCPGSAPCAIAQPRMSAVGTPIHEAMRRKGVEASTMGGGTKASNPVSSMVGVGRILQGSALTA